MSQLKADTHTNTHLPAVDELCGRYMGWNVAIKISFSEHGKGKLGAWSEQKYLERGDEEVLGWSQTPFAINTFDDPKYIK